MRSKGHTQKITQQAAGAFGEKAVEAELLRHNWIPANVNQTVKNAAKFDIYAVKGDRSVQVRVKTCRPGMPAFPMGGFAPGNPITTNDITDSDFTIIAVWVSSGRTIFSISCRLPLPGRRLPQGNLNTKSGV
jgi:hypothetical protein